ncbi:glycerol-3-phosphate 1-O-acyltransferase PlsY [Psychromonas sp. 14N.309.X.WAT.B.A12]|jgi:acyl phosphate:glycerol-3-phosphate acyltransferase|uniref:glycerol-3-phosphate 1-O-acyltransferase PlsY n=1 Tax=unclassified Psychromonas TaxID=2614957 RepID=UPI0025B01BD2|nr:glycerol-3-phosphate 1-O-acyltransferase PlsY [Psychromonas sp. 14N.309.X.WAT.B.A12]MDN2664042.1 glycerol-3-phosphate 1-O-acyltransferase PlsY [Psychromonas sp. 14N.309.X.WAT.B.A12]
MIILATLIFSISAYFLGAVNGAILLCKYKGWPDPRTHGSKNPGATNMLRMHHAQAASLVLIFDLLKGTIPVYLAYFVGIPPFAIGFIGIATCLGHIFPPYFNFKGGKAVATGLGTLLPLGMDMTGLVVITWLLTVAISGYASLAAIITAIAAPVYVHLIKPEFTLPVLMLSCLIILRHISNIRRLLIGKEKKIVNWKQ